MSCCESQTNPSSDSTTTMRPPMRRHDFKVGEKVEVVGNEDGFFGSYYRAKIMSCLENGQYVVEYKNLLENDESKPLTETRLPKELRPLPPIIKTRNYVCGQVVDAYDNDGWWVGRISMIYPPEKRKGTWRYRVYFQDTGEDLWYPGKRVRVHQEWNGGEWIRS